MRWSRAGKSNIPTLNFPRQHTTYHSPGAYTAHCSSLACLGVLTLTACYPSPASVGPRWRLCGASVGPLRGLFGASLVASVVPRRGLGRASVVTPAATQTRRAQLRLLPRPRSVSDWPVRHWAERREATAVRRARGAVLSRVLTAPTAASAAEHRRGRPGGGERPGDAGTRYRCCSVDTYLGAWAEW